MFKKILILPAALFAFACGGDKKVDDALNSDLSTAAQATPYTPLDSITAAERARAGTPAGATALRSTSAAPRTTTVRRTTTTRSSGTRSTASAPVYSAPAPAPVVVKHT
ncbi:MAG TPA: hypothetical protein VF014_04725, partial [Casimicrobiaceae bacterium]|nr:hypothetical protein [Casimicrobiaceae bacterium]